MWIEKVGPSGYDARILKTRILKSFWSKHVCKRIRPKTLIQGGTCTFWDILHARIRWSYDYDLRVFGGSVRIPGILTEPPKFRNFVSSHIHPPPPVQCWKHSRATAKMMISGCNFDHRAFQHWTGGRGSRIDDDECELFYVLISKCGHRNQNSGKFVSIFSSKKETIFLNIFFFQTCIFITYALSEWIREFRVCWHDCNRRMLPQADPLGQNAQLHDATN